MPWILSIINVLQNLNLKGYFLLNDLNYKILNIKLQSLTNKISRHLKKTKKQKQNSALVPTFLLDGLNNCALVWDQDSF